MRDLEAKFLETGSVANKIKNVKYPIRNEAVEVGILGHIAIDATLSSRKLSEASGVSHSESFKNSIQQTKTG